jgi:DNA-binding transcriptional ArsR family regulator
MSQSTESEAHFVQRILPELHLVVGDEQRHEWSVAREFDRLRGRADVVVARSRGEPSGSLGMQAAMQAVSPAKAAILSLLPCGAPRTIRFLSRRSGLAESTLSRHIRQLAVAGAVDITPTGRVLLRHRLPWNYLEITAFEAKLKDWRRALYQARRYRGYAHKSWVTMPSESVNAASKNRQAFKALNVGLISVNREGRQRILVRPRRERPDSKRLLLQGIGMILATGLKPEFCPEPID